MIVPNAKFRPNPKRAVYVQGTINQELVQKLTPQIVSLQAQNRSPITVYIDSNGGSVPITQNLWKLLNASNQEFDRPCDIITVATTRAASAAADLLSLGDYAITYPHSTILYHGSRTFREREPSFPLTLETTAMISFLLRLTNEASAINLLRRMESRFMFRFLLSKSTFASIRLKNPKKSMTDTDCFLALIEDSLSGNAKKLFETARERQGRYDALLAIAKKSSRVKRTPAIEAKWLKAIIDFELKTNKNNKDWTFQSEGLGKLNEDFFLLNEHLETSQEKRINKLCSEWGVFALTAEDQEEINQAADEAAKNALLIQKVRPLLEPLWAFYVALCHALQGGENDLTATDAFWLGLIDEVVGLRELRSIRSIAEYKPDPEPGQQSSLPEGPYAPAPALPASAGTSQAPEAK